MLSPTWCNQMPCQVRGRFGSTAAVAGFDFPRPARFLRPSDADPGSCILAPPGFTCAGRIDSGSACRHAPDMKRIFVPTRNGSDWQRLLAKPELHWKSGRSAMTAAACWDDAADRLPRDIAQVLSGSGVPELKDLRLLLAIPEWEVPLPGGSRPSFTDVLAVATNRSGLCTIAVEAKAGEDFGPTIAARTLEASAGQESRLAYLQELLGRQFHAAIRYQLLHRTASAIIVARDFHAETTVMLVHAWNSTPEQRRDFEAFSEAMGAEERGPNVRAIARSDAPSLFLAWCDGAPEFLRASLPVGT